MIMTRRVYHFYGALAHSQANCPKSELAGRLAPPGQSNSDPAAELNPSAASFSFQCDVATTVVPARSCDGRHRARIGKISETSITMVITLMAGAYFPRF